MLIHSVVFMLLVRSALIVSKQASLFKYGFTRQFQHRNETYNFTAAGDIVPKTNGIYKCHLYNNKWFLSKQGLASHTMWDHHSSNHSELKSEAALKEYNKDQKRSEDYVRQFVDICQTKMSKPSN